MTERLSKSVGNNVACLYFDQGKSADNEPSVGPTIGHFRLYGQETRYVIEIHWTAHAGGQQQNGLLEVEMMEINLMLKNILFILLFQTIALYLQAS